jgi:protein-L-isoaspartate(D-aspartate) O-methyltransferase
VIHPHEPSRRELAAAAERWSHAQPDRWAEVPPDLDEAIAADRDLAQAARWARRHLLRDALRRLGDLVPPGELARYAEALIDVPRERFVLPEEIAFSADDAPSPLDRAGLATVSAPHAYVLTYGLLALGEGDHLLELGSGTGYGAALGSHLVGASGLVTSVEIDPVLHARAVRLLGRPDARGPAPVILLPGDARELAPALLSSGAGRPVAGSGRARPSRVAVTYALPEDPVPLLDVLPEGGRLVAPVATNGDEQILTRWVRECGDLVQTTHGAVRYVSERS